MIKWLKREPDLIYEKPCKGLCQYGQDVGAPEASCGGRFCYPKYATKEMEAKLDKARLFYIRFSTIYFRMLYIYFRSKSDKRWRPRFFTSMRHANCWSITIGPVCIHLRAKWLYGPAEQAIEQMNCSGEQSQ